MTQRIRLGDLLVRAGVIGTTQLNAALAEQRRWGGRLGHILVEMHFLSESLLVRALSKQLGVDVASFKQVEVPRRFVRRLDPEQLRSGGACPIWVSPDEKHLDLAMVDPTDLRVMDDVRFRTGCKVHPKIAGESEVANAINRLYGKETYPQVELETRPIERERPAEADASVPSPAPEVDVFEAEALETGSLAAAAAEGQLREHQLRHERALRVMVDLLIEKGVFTREEYLALLAQRE